MKNTPRQNYNYIEDYPRLAGELGPRDVVFRADFDEEKLFSMPPFISEQCPMVEKHLQVWDRLYAGEITEDQALEQITRLMEEYYGTKYPLQRTLNHPESEYKTVIGR